MSSEEDNKVEFQEYRSSMQSHKMVRPDGKVLHIIGGKFITKDVKDIEYLEGEIAAGFPYLKAGKAVSSAELDPMAALKRKHILEYLEEEQRQAGGAQEVKDMGSTTKDAVVPLSTEKVGAQLAHTVALNALKGKLGTGEGEDSDK